ncbi:hypothetical protein ACQPW3_21220 [Actinosynnema sp. CA-248983]
MATSARRPLPEHVCGEQVRLALVEARPAGLTARQLVAATKLSPSQVRRGLLHVRTVLASQHATPLIWTRRDGYRLAPDLPELIDYERAQFRMELTRISRLVTAVIDPHHARFPDDDWIHLVRDQLVGVKAMVVGLTRQEPPPARTGPAARAGRRRTP